MKNKKPQAIVTEAKKKTIELLAKFGIQDKFMVRVKKPKNNWVAMYRGHTQFTNNHGPIFWISDVLLKNPDELIISMLHEYGHVIAEWAWCRSSEMRELISNNWTRTLALEVSHNRNWDEEEFAEDFAQFIYSQSPWVNQEAILKVISIFTKEVFIPQEVA